jgi:hypothetical protein
MTQTISIFSYPGYAGYRPPLAWVWCQPLARLCGGNSLQEQCAAIRKHTEGALLQGGVEPPWARVVGGLALRSEAFAQRLRGEARGNPREQASLPGAPEASAWPRIPSALERSKGESWNSLAERHGHWGRDAALWQGRRTARFPSADLGKSTGGLGYAVVSKALARFGRRLEADPRLRAEIAAIQDRLSK